MTYTRALLHAAAAGSYISNGYNILYCIRRVCCFALPMWIINLRHRLINNSVNGGPKCIYYLPTVQRLECCRPIRDKILLNRTVYYVGPRWEIIILIIYESNWIKIETDDRVKK